MSKYDILASVLMSKKDYECGKHDIRPYFRCKNRFLNVKITYSAQFECQNRIVNVKIRYLALFRGSQMGF